MKNEEFLTVSELNQFIKDVVSSGFPQALWVCGEIQNFRDKKHIYFELVEKDQDSSQVKAKINVAIWATKKAHINQILSRSENAFQLKDDIEVKLSCTVNYWVQGGSLSLIVESIDPVYTLGKLAQERQKLIAELKAKGALDKNKQLELPLVPLRIGLITSDDSAAYNDFYAELQKSGFGFTIYLRHTTMQGKKTEKDVCRALKELSAIEELDLVVITRGGGSMADLSCFDSKMIAEQIAQYPLPVLSGIGHEINTTITDLAAHTFAKTPTAIAQFLIVRVQDYLNNLEDGMSRIQEAVDNKIEEDKNKLRDFALNLDEYTRQFFKDHHEGLIRMMEVIKHRPVSVLREYKKMILSQKDILSKAVKGRLANSQLRLMSYEKIVDIVSPINTMKRGFTITRDSQGKILRNITQAQLKDAITTELVDGVVESRVEELKEKKHG